MYLCFSLRVYMALSIYFVYASLYMYTYICMYEYVYAYCLSFELYIKGKRKWEKENRLNYSDILQNMQNRPGMSYRWTLY